jgi:hypothetical protein
MEYTTILDETSRTANERRIRRRSFATLEAHMLVYGFTEFLWQALNY